MNLSLRTRLAAGAGFVAVVLAFVSIAVTVTTRTRLLGQVDARLEDISGRGPKSGMPEPFRTDSLRLPPPPQLPGDGPERPSDIFQGYIGLGGVLETRFAPNVGDDDSESRPEIDPGNLPAAGRALFTANATTGDGTFRVLADRRPEGTSISAVRLDPVSRTINQLILVELGGSVIILAALGLVAWWVMRLGVRPVREITRTAARIAAGDLTVRIPETAPGTESAELATSLNAMLAHLDEAMRQRAESDERLRRFVADASHELRTPITTIRGYAELYLQGGLSEDAALHDAMRRTKAEAARMGRLVEDMLTLAKLDRQRPLELRPLDLAALVRDAASDAQVAERRLIEMELGDGPALVIADEDRLRQVITNVLGNALTHTRPHVPVLVRVSRNNGDVTVAVVDHGDGMPPEVAARVTERFFRADPSRTRASGGNGLGLSIAEAAIAAHGGALSVESELTRGTTVRFSLPSASPEQHAANGAVAQ